MRAIGKNSHGVSKKHYILIRMMTSLFLLLLSQHSFAQKKKPTIDSYIDHLFNITEVMVTDVASPPAAARFYAYTTLAAYLAWEKTNGFQTESSLIAKTNLSYPQLEAPKTYLSPELVSILSMLEVGKRIMPSGKSLVEAESNLIREASKKGWISKKNINANIEYAKHVADKVMDLANSDGYLQLSTLTRYTPKKGEGFWYPTPPAYMGAIEPEWRTIRPFFLENLNAFKPLPPAEFSLENESSFYQQLMEVYDISKKLSEEEILIANFWDCNPFMVQYSGHMAIGIKKISPGGHWIGITGIASQKADLDWSKTLYIHALVAMGLHDAFISCWEEKYDSDRIRPESAINKYVDQEWRPILQTPPFPEYTSGHSVISTTSAHLLTDFFGDDFDFIDTSEVYFGLPEREFKSFFQASEEAAISRLYGGIHFRDAIEEGVQQGKKISEHILKTLYP